MLARALLVSKISARTPCSARIAAIPTRGFSAKPFYSAKNFSFVPKCRSSTVFTMPKTALAQPRRYFADSPFLKEADVEGRVLHVVKSFQKIDPQAVKKDSKFTDLGLDSLDIVELGLEIESEFAVEIPDAEMEKINSIPDAVKYICSHPTAK